MSDPDQPQPVCRTRPCPACPYRRDVPSGIWDAEEYAKLLAYDRPTGEQPLAAFACHATPQRLCHGWAVTHSNRGHEHELLALRLLDLTPPDGPAPVPLFESGQQAAEHGLRDPLPGPDAIRAIRRLRRYPRLAADPDTP